MDLSKLNSSFTGLSNIDHLSKDGAAIIIPETSQGSLLYSDNSNSGLGMGKCPTMMNHCCGDDDPELTHCVFDVDGIGLTMGSPLKSVNSSGGIYGLATIASSRPFSTPNSPMKPLESSEGNFTNVVSSPMKLLELANACAERYVSG